MMTTGEAAISVPTVGIVLVIAVIIIAIIAISKKRGGSDQPEAQMHPAAAPVPAIDEESYAVLLAAISEEARLSGEEIRVVSIREI